MLSETETKKLRAFARGLKSKGVTRNTFKAAIHMQPIKDSTYEHCEYVYNLLDSF